MNQPIPVNDCRSYIDRTKICGRVCIENRKKSLHLATPNAYYFCKTVQPLQPVAVQILGARHIDQLLHLVWNGSSLRTHTHLLLLPHSIEKAALLLGVRFQLPDLVPQGLLLGLPGSPAISSATGVVLRL